MQIIFFKQTLKRPTLGLNPDAVILCNTIKIIFPINEIQRLIVESTLHHIILITVLNCVQKELQLILYIQGESRIDKSQVINVIELGFSLLSCRADLVLAAPIRAIASNIKKSTIHTYLGIGVRNNQKNTNKVSRMWIQRYALIIDEVTMVELDMLSNIAKQLVKAKGFISESTAIFGKLLIVILMEDIH